MRTPHFTRSVESIIHSVAILLVITAAVSFTGDLRAQPTTPTEVFTAYRAALAKATTISEVLPFMESNGRRMLEALPEQQRAGMFDLLKRFASTYSDVAVANETMTGESAVLSLTGKDPKGQAATGTVPMTKEASGWKVGTEKWSSRPR